MHSICNRLDGMNGLWPVKLMCRECFQMSLQRSGLLIASALQHRAYCRAATRMGRITGLQAVHSLCYQLRPISLVQPGQYIAESRSPRSRKRQHGLRQGLDFARIGLLQPRHQSLKNRAQLHRLSGLWWMKVHHKISCVFHEKIPHTGHQNPAR